MSLSTSHAQVKENSNKPVLLPRKQLSPQVSQRRTLGTKLQTQAERYTHNLTLPRVTVTSPRRLWLVGFHFPPHRVWGPASLLNTKNNYAFHSPLFYRRSDHLNEINYSNLSSPGYQDVGHLKISHLPLLLHLPACHMGHLLWLRKGNGSLLNVQSLYEPSERPVCRHNGIPNFSGLPEHLRQKIHMVWDTPRK